MLVVNIVTFNVDSILSLLICLVNFLKHIYVFEKIHQKY